MFFKNKTNKTPPDEKTNLKALIRRTSQEISAFLNKWLAKSCLQRRLCGLFLFPPMCVCVREVLCTDRQYDNSGKEERDNVQVQKIKEIE